MRKIILPIVGIALLALAGGDAVRAQWVSGSGNGGAGTPGGTSGQIQYNNASSFGGFTQGGDCTTNTSTGLTTCLKLNNVAPGTIWTLSIPVTADLLGSDGSNLTTITLGTGLALTSNVLNLTSVFVDRSSANDAIVTGDASKIVLLGAHTYTLAQAGSAGFGNGWGACLLATAGPATVTATTSTFVGATGTTSLTMLAGDVACPNSNGTNYNTTSNPSLVATGTGSVVRSISPTGTGTWTLPTVVGSGRIVTGTSDGPTATDCGGTIHFTSGSGITVTMPNSITTLQCTITFIQEGAGQITFAAGSGATIHSRSSFTKTAGQWAVVDMILNTNAGGTSAVYTLAGDGA